MQGNIQDAAAVSSAQNGVGLGRGKPTWEERSEKAHEGRTCETISEGKQDNTLKQAAGCSF